MLKLVMILENEGNENREKGEAKTFGACVISFFCVLDVLHFIMRRDFLFSLFFV